MDGQYQATVLVLTPDWWQKFGKQILAVERTCFGKMAYRSGRLKRELRKPEFRAVMLTAGAKVIGFTYAKLEGQTAEIRDTAILPSFQGRGLVGTLMSRMEAELKSQGIRYLIRDAAVDNGYADAIARHYGPRILRSRDHRSKYGPQRFFKIAL